MLYFLKRYVNRIEIDWLLSEDTCETFTELIAVLKSCDFGHQYLDTYSKDGTDIMVSVDIDENGKNDLKAEYSKRLRDVFSEKSYWINNLKDIQNLVLNNKIIAIQLKMEYHGYIISYY
jgi:hypothetical protein